MEASASFEEFVNYSRLYDRKIILLFKMGVTQDRSAFQYECDSEVSPLHLQKPHMKSWLFVRVLACFFLVGELTNEILH